MTYATGIKVENFYDKLDRLVEVCYTDTNNGNVIIKHYRYHYTKDGSIARVDDVLTGTYTVYQYNTSGALMEVIQVDATNHVDSFFTYTYNDQNALHTAKFNYKYDVGSETELGIVLYSYEYDDSNILESYTIGSAGTAADGNIAFMYDDIGRTIQKNTYLTGFTNETEITFVEKIQQSTSLISTFKSTINQGTTTTYTFTYDIRGNITRITDTAGNITTYVYDDQNQLTRENFSNASDSTKSYTYVYEYDKAGNRTSRKKYAYTTGSVASLTPTSTQTLTYNINTEAWGDQLANTTYDALGNPLTYNSNNLTWQGRQLMEISMAGGQFRYTFTYNDEGLRTSKTAGGYTHKYVWEGSTLVSESWGNHLLIYLYDESGSPIGLQYRSTAYAEGVFDTYYFEKNLFGDIVAVYNTSGAKIGSYTYDAWGNFTTSVENTASSAERRIVNTLNPFRYRGYYYDTETQLYCLQGKYYNPMTGRFVQPSDGTNSTGINRLNLYNYANNPTSIAYGGSSEKGIVGVGRASSKLTAFNATLNSASNSLNTLSLPAIPWLVENATSIYGIVSSLSAGIPILCHYYKYSSIINSEFRLYGISKWKTSLQLSNVSFKMGALDGALIGVNVLIDLYDSYQRGVSCEGIFLGGALTAVSGVGMLYLNKGIMWAATTIGTAISPGIGTAIGFTVGLIGSISVDYFLGGWIADRIDEKIT